MPRFSWHIKSTKCKNNYCSFIYWFIIEIPGYYAYHGAIIVTHLSRSIGLASTAASLHIAPAQSPLVECTVYRKEISVFITRPITIVWVAYMSEVKLIRMSMAYK